MKIIKTCIVLLFLSHFFIYSQDNLFDKSFEGREWEFLQYRFQDRFSLVDLLKTIGASLGIAGGSIYCIVKLFNIKPSKTSAELVVAAGVALGFLTFFERLTHYDRQAKIKKAINFIKKWPDNKKYSPAYFYSAFDELFELYQQEGETKAFRSKILELIWIIDRAILNRTVHIVYR